MWKFLRFKGSFHSGFQPNLLHFKELSISLSKKGYMQLKLLSAGYQNLQNCTLYKTISIMLIKYLKADEP